jgi:hypothetical protein
MPGRVAHHEDSLFTRRSSRRPRAMVGLGGVDHYGSMNDAAEPITPMTDAEADLFRFLRYGQLPERVRPADAVETVDTSTRQDIPDVVADPTSVWSLRYY